MRGEYCVGDNGETWSEQEDKKGCTATLHNHRIVTLHTRDGRSLCVSKQ